MTTLKCPDRHDRGGFHLASGTRQIKDDGSDLPEIDFVITWVDRSDPAWSAGYRQARLKSNKVGGLQRHEGLEIYYLIASIIKYASFGNKIFIITDNQKPAMFDEFVASGLCAPDRLRLVSHDVIFHDLEVKRPTFNSLVIEAAMWRIPGLAEQFVYCNDDMFLNAPLTEEDFFRRGKPVIGGAMAIPDAWRPRTFARKFLARLLGRATREPVRHSRVQERGARLAGIKNRFLMTHHHPHPLRRSTAEAFHAARPDALAGQMQHQFRQNSQYLPVALYNHLERRQHGVSFGSKRSVAYLKPACSAAELERVLAEIRDASVPFGCIQSLEKFSPEAQARIHATLREKFSSTLPPELKPAD